MRALFALFVRAVREDARARLPPILRAILVLVILLILWANERDFASRTAPGREFLGMVLFANLGLIVIATLGIFSSAITEEKEDQTITLLRMTKLSPLAILFGKSTTRLIGALLLLAAQIPFTLLAVTLGGVSLDQVLNAYAVLGATTFLLCNLALLCSVLCRTTLRAGVWTGLVGGVVFVLLPIICIVTALEKMPFGALTPNTAWEHFGTWLVESNPVYTLAVMIFETGKTAPVGWHITVNLAGGTLCFLISWLVFDRFCAGDEEVVVRRQRQAGAGFFSRRRSRPSTRCPIAWKDFHFLIGGWRGLLTRSSICAVLSFSVCAFVRWVDDIEPHLVYFWTQAGEKIMVSAFGVFAIDASLTASRVFGEERRNRTLGSLVTLPNSAGSLIRQMVLGCLPSLLPPIALFGNGFYLRFFWSDESFFDWWDRFMEAAFYIFSQSTLLFVLVAYLSLRIRRGAMPVGTAAVVALNVLTAVILNIPAAMHKSEKLILAGVCGFITAALLIVGIYRRLPAAAAAE